MTDENTLTSCVMCGTEMKAGFSICPQCQSHQNKNKRVVKRIINIFSGLSIVLGALTVIVSFFPKVKNALFYHEDIDLVSINATMSATPGNMSFVNKGDGDVYVSELVMTLSEYDLPFELRIPIHKLIKKNEMEAIRFHSKRASSKVYSDTVGKNQFDRWVKSRSVEQITQSIHRCFLLKPFDQEKGSYLIKREVSSVKLKAAIHFFSLETKSVRVFNSETSVQGLLFRRGSEDCKT